MHSTYLRLPVILIVIYCLCEQAIAQINLGTAAQFGIIASTAISNTGDTTINGRLGISPNTASSITGFPPGVSTGVNAGDGDALQARADARTAYNAAAAMSPTGGSLAADIGGRTLVAGTYSSSSSLGITGALTLDGQNDPNALFVFQIGSTLTTATASSVVLINGAQACNVFWQVGSSATLGTTTTFAGTILALTSITLEKGVTVAGGLYALNAAVTLNNDVVTPQTCAAQISSTPATVPTTSSASIPGNGVPPGSGFPTTVPGNDNPAPVPGDDSPEPGPGDDFPTSPPETESSKTSSSVVSTNNPTITKASSTLTTSSSMPLSTRITSSEDNTQLPSVTPAVTTLTIPANTSTTYDMVTTINGTPCTTLSYYEATCSCTRTTVVPLAFTPAPSLSIAAVEITVLNGVPCTTTRYYESTCDCILTSVVPIQVASATASIVTVIDGVPCTASKYYDSACDCVKTAAVPVRTASVGESACPTPTSTGKTTAVACAQTSQYLLSCMSACMELYLPVVTENVTATQSCSATPK